MKAFVFERPGKGSIQNMDVVKPGFDEVLLKVEFCGVCGTDMHIWRGTEPSAHRVILGHEFCGTILETGEGVTTHKSGQRVSVDPNIYCKKCEFCRAGKVNLCSSLKALGVDIDGGFAAYCVVPESQIYSIPAEMSWEEAALVEPVACAIYGIKQAEIETGDHVLIMGGGPIGLIMLQLARLHGASHVTLSEKVAWRRNIGKTIGADTVLDPSHENLSNLLKTSRLPDVVIECIGNPATQAEALDVVRRGGKVVLFGDGKVGETFPVGSYTFYYKNLTVRGAALNPFTHDRAIALLANKRIQTAPLVSRTIHLDELPALLENGYLEKDVKVLVKPVN